MDFVFQGFQSGLPVWLCLLLGAAASVLAWWSYRHLKSIPVRWRVLMSFLRAAVFLILLILLLNPFFRAEETVERPPELLVFLDASSSTGITRNDYEGMQSYRDAISRLGLGERDGVAFSYYAFDREVRGIPSTDSLRAEGDETNLYSIFEVLEDRRQEASAAILLSDGIFTRGRSPAFEAASSPLPIYTVALGDTARQQDLMVENIVTNSTGYLNTSQPVEVTIGANGFAGSAVRVELRRGDLLIDAQQVRPALDDQSVDLTFQLSPEETGLQQYRVVIPAMEGEWSPENNSRPFSVDVLDDKQRIFSVALEVHPDVRLMRRLLTGDENTRLSARTWLGGSRFIEGPFRFDPDTLDLLVLHGYPGSGLPSGVSEQLNDILETVPVIFSNTPSSSLGRLQEDLEAPLAVRVRRDAPPREVSPLPAAEPTAHPVMELPAVVYNRLPSLQAPVDGLEPLTGSVILFESSYLGTATGHPLVAVSEIGNLRSAFLAGFGWYRLAQSAGESDRAFLQQLMLNLVSWTATRPDNRLLTVEPSRQTFSGSDPIILNAYLRNESGELESDASIQVTINGSEIEERFYSMQNSGPGQYTLQIPALPQGLYSFEAEATKGDRTIDTRIGEFSVSRNNSELIDTRRNDRLLRQVSEASGGSFYVHDSLDGFWENLENDGRLQAGEQVRQTLFYPYRYWPWFLAVVLLLGAEWVLRKYFSLP